MTLTRDGDAAVQARIALLKARVTAGDCELVAKVFALGRERGFLYIGDDGWVTDEVRRPWVAESEVRALGVAKQAALTLTCVPPGSGIRLGIDRDLDGDE